MGRESGEGKVGEGGSGEEEEEKENSSWRGCGTKGSKLVTC